MCKTLIALIALTLTVHSYAAEKSDKELVELHQGVWKPIAASMNGKRLPKVALDMITLTITGTNYVVAVEGEDHDDKGTFAIDTSAKPHRMTIKSNEGPNKGKTFLAVFEHKHEDAMRVCYDLSGKEFPTVWRTKKGSPLYVVGYRRKKEVAK